MANIKKLKKSGKSKTPKFKMSQKKLTANERKLLYMLAIIGILIIGGKYILLPAYQEMESLKLQSEELSAKKAAAEATIEGLEATELETQRLMTQIHANSNNISPFLNDEGVDNLITTLCLENALKPVALAIESEPYDKLSLEQSAETSAPADAPAEEQPAEPKAVNYTRSAEVNLVLTGSRQSMLSFIDNINSVPYLLVESFTSSFLEASQDQTHSIRIKINMLNTEIK